MMREMLVWFLGLFTVMYLFNDFKYINFLLGAILICLSIDTIELIGRWLKDD